MNRFASLAAIALLLTACGYSNQVRKPTLSKYGPTNQKAIGIVKYRSNVADSDLNREHALKRMYGSCNRKYRILSEEKKNEGGAAMPIGGIFIANAIIWTYIEYECLAK